MCVAARLQVWVFFILITESSSTDRYLWIWSGRECRQVNTTPSNAGSEYAVRSIDLDSTRLTRWFILLCRDIHQYDNDYMKIEYIW